MKLQKSDRTRFILGLILVIFIYSCFLIFFVDQRNTNNIPRKLRHVISLVFIVAQYIAGIVFLRKLKMSWMKNLWNIIYVVGLLVITSIGLYDWAVLTQRTSKELSMFARTVQELLMSPMLYLAMGLLHVTLIRSSRNKEIKEKK